MRRGPRERKVAVQKELSLQDSVSSLVDWNSVILVVGEIGLVVIIVSPSTDGSTRSTAIGALAGVFAGRLSLPASIQAKGP